MKILAFHPADPDIGYFQKMPPLGMLWVCGTLRRLGGEINFVDAQVDDRDPAACADSMRPTFALIGGTSHSRFASFAAAEAIRRASPETRIVYGGPHASFTAEDTLRHVPAIDFVVRGEGELTCAELMEWAGGEGTWAQLSGIRGLSYREDGAPRHNPPRPPIADLDALGPPDRDLARMDRYGMTMEHLGIPGASLITARGCPVACNFCAASALFGTSYRRRSPKGVVDEIELLLSRHGARGIKIFDSTFTFSRSHVEGFCRELRRRGLHVPWECEIRVGSVDKGLLAEMREAGCYYVDVGVEAGSQRVLDQCIGKRIRLEDAERLLCWLEDLGLRSKVFFTLGHPGETYAEASLTNRFIRRHRRRITVAGYNSGIRIYPGTQVEEHARRQGLLPSAFRWSAPYVNEGQRSLFRPVDSIPVLLQPGLGLKELRRLRIAFILDRVRSGRYLRDKIRFVLDSRQARRYLGIVFGGFRTEPRGSGSSAARARARAEAGPAAAEEGQP